MSMSEPLLPHPGPDSDRTAAAEPGPAGPDPVAPEEPDVLPDPAGTGEPDPGLPEQTPFRTPVAGEGLRPDDFAAADGETATD